MKKFIYDFVSWRVGYSYYHPVFYATIKTNFTPSHIHAWPQKKVYTPLNDIKNANLYYLKNSVFIREKGNLDAYKRANQFDLENGSHEFLSDAERKIIFKRFVKKNDLKSITSLISKFGIKTEEYYYLASSFLKEASARELTNLLEKGFASGIPPTAVLVKNIFEKAYKSEDMESCEKLWTYFPFVKRDSSLEHAVLLRLKLLKKAQDLLPVYKNAKEWQVLTPRVKLEIWGKVQKLVKCRWTLKDWKYALKIPNSNKFKT